jgi:hypothetical protein
MLSFWFVTSNASAAQGDLETQLRFFRAKGFDLLLAHYINPLPGRDVIKIGTAERCIYCGCENEPLWTEHVIPEAIGGGLLLLKATCPCGPKRTHGFEGKVTNQIFQQMRRQLGIKGKKRKRSPESLLLPVYDKFIEPFDPTLARKVAIEDHPSMLLIPRIQILKRLGSGQMFQAVKGTPLPMDIWDLVPDSKQRTDRMREAGAPGSWLLQNVEIDPLLRLLAKIAHAAAIARLGYDGFNHLLVDIISGVMSGAMELVGELPGSAPSLFPFGPRRGLHEVAVGLHKEGSAEFVLVHIRLFSNLMRPQLPFFTPAYAVIAGTLTSEQRERIALH